MMKNLYCVICSKNRKFEKPKISYLLSKSKLNSIEVLISKVLIDSVISHD